MDDHASAGGEALSGDLPAAGPDAAALEAAARVEAGRLLFARECRFLRGVVALDGLPPADLPELAFSGRSNVGKSSIINALTGRNGLARTSNTPGRTQELNYFDLGGRLVLVDLPGYGFASAPKTEVARWTRLVESFLRGRSVLRRVVVLVDSRHGLKDSDRDMMSMLDRAAVVYQVVLTKADKITPGALEATRERVVAEIAKRGAAHPSVIATSSQTGLGLADLRAELATLARGESAT
ncbi:MAG: hypothetical protein RLZZ501_608 [Pseudomonadota bacterium]|jgi:GTP-binding protein